jgi:hypothetical protein
MHENIEGSIAQHEKEQHFMLRENDDYLRASITTLQGIIEQQDALIAILWKKIYGHELSSGGYVGAEYVSTTYDRLNKSWGMRPPWTVATDQVCFEFNYLQREERYPWGKDARWLREGNSYQED